VKVLDCSEQNDMMKRETFPIAMIYVPVKRRAMLDPKKLQEIAESILQVGLQSPILVRQDGERFVLGSRLIKSTI
jgi:sulfiredoxin